MANSILTQIFASDPLKIFDTTKDQPVLTGLSVVSVGFRFTSQLMINRDELGRPIVDSRVVYPSEVHVDVLLDTIEKVDQVNKVMMNTSSLYRITSRGMVFNNYRISVNSNSQTPEMISASPVRIVFRQVLLQNGEVKECKQDGDSSTFIGGIRSTIDTAASKATEFIDSVKASASQLFGG